jgi:hypothetical protein
VLEVLPDRVRLVHEHARDPSFRESVGDATHHLTLAVRQSLHRIRVERCGLGGRAPTELGGAVDRGEVRAEEPQDELLAATEVSTTEHRELD